MPENYHHTAKEFLKKVGEHCSFHTQECKRPFFMADEINPHEIKITSIASKLKREGVNMISLTKIARELGKKAIYLSYGIESDINRQSEGAAADANDHFVQFNNRLKKDGELKEALTQLIKEHKV